MRWLVVVVMVGACADDNSFRRIEDIPPLECNHTGQVAEGHVYGEIRMATGTRSFGPLNVAAVDPSATTISLGDGEMTLNVGAYSAQQTQAMYQGDFQFASSSRLQQ